MRPSRLIGWCFGISVLVLGFLFFRYRLQVDADGMAEMFVINPYHNMNSMDVVDLHGTVASEASLKNSYVSITPIGDEEFVVANYANLILLDRKNRVSCVMREVVGSDGDVIPSQIPNGVFVPTGVFFDGKSFLYVANYKGNNVLRLRVNSDKCEFEFDRVYGEGAAKGSENVYADTAQDVLVSANYDAGNVNAFRISTGKQLWETDIGQAHGVAIVNDKVYVTGLTERKLYELELTSGRIVRSAGSLGWDVGREQFLWPTTVHPFGESELVISDPQTGFISFIDRESLQAKRYTGGNGPSYRWLSYPYAAVPYVRGLIVLSSMRGQVLFLEPQSLTVSESLYYPLGTWPELAKLQPHFGAGWDGYIEKSVSRLDVFGRKYRMGFGHLHPESKAPVFRVPNSGSLFNSDTYIYFTQGQMISPDSGVFFSSSAGVLIGFRAGHGAAPIILSSPIQLDSWLVGEDLVNQGKVLTKTEMSDYFKKRFEQVDRMRLDGWLSPDELFEAGEWQGGRERFDATLDDVFLSPAGKVFLHSYKRCSSDSCEVSKLRAAAARYYSEVSGLPYVEMDEYFLVGMLANVSPEASTSAAAGVRYSLCSDEKYYEGYGLEVLETTALDDYLSALDLASSRVCFTRLGDRPAEIIGLRVIWFSDSEQAKKLRISGVVSANGMQSKELIADVNVNSRSTLGHLQSNIELDARGRVYQSYMIEAVKGGGQDRLILRAIYPIFSNAADGRPDKLERSVMNASGMTTAPMNRETEFIRRAFNDLIQTEAPEFAAALVSKLPGSIDWKVYLLRSTDGLVHAVVEVADGVQKRTADPLLGIVYPCEVDVILHGECDLDALPLPESVGPLYSPYHGYGFLLDADIIKVVRKSDVTDFQSGNRNVL